MDLFCKRNIYVYIMKLAWKCLQYYMKMFLCQGKESHSTITFQKFSTSVFYFSVIHPNENIYMFLYVVYIKPHI